VLDPGFSVECEAHNFHVNEDHFYAETVDGELVVTTLCREAIPLLRYRTRIACELFKDKCPCGRTGALLCPGIRLDQQLRINETVLYRRQIDEVLEHSRAAGAPYEIEVQDSRIVVSLDVRSGLFSDMMWEMIDRRREIESEFYNRLGIEADVHFVVPAGGVPPLRGGKGDVS
jgi:phenylacetate-CoA ligase